MPLIDTSMHVSNQPSPPVNLSPAKTPTTTDQSIFDVSEDYAAIVAEFAAPNTPNASITRTEGSSAMAVLTAQSVPLIDSSIFEDVMDDYTEVAGESVTSDVSVCPNNSTQTLARLVNEGNYEEAERARAELVELGVPIPPSRIYEKAAQVVLRRSNLQSRLEAFTNWFSLIPEAHLSKPRMFNETRRLIFLAPVTNMILIIRFAIICASKGYAEVVQMQVIPVVMRFTDPEVSAQFLKDFGRANERYWTKFRPTDAFFMLRRSYATTRGLAIRSLAFAGRLGEAVQLLPEAQANFRLSPYTYDVLLRKLRQKTPKEALDIDHIKLVLRLRGYDYGLNDIDSDFIDSQAQYAEMAASLNTCPPEPPGDDLALTLRYLKKAILSYELPHPFTFVNFMESYLATGRSRAVTLLRNKALRCNHRSTAVFIFAEMLYYRRQGWHDLVVLTFIDHFYLTGVPRDDVIKRLQHWEKIKVEESGGLSRPNNGVPPSKGKVWPSAVHCALVWHSLVAHTTGDQPLERLYHKLLQHAHGKPDEQRFDLDSPHYSDASPLLPPPSWKHKVDRAAFTPFIRRLMFAFGPSRGALLLSDMLKAGIEPSVYHFTELAGHYARTGDLPRAFLVLERMEANLAKPKDATPLEGVDRSHPVGRRGKSTVDSIIAEQEKASSSSSATHHQLIPDLLFPCPDVNASGEDGEAVRVAWDRGDEQLDSGRTKSTVDEAHGDQEHFSPSPKSPRPILGPSFPSPDIVIYISLMRGFLIARSLEGAEEAERRMRKHYEYNPGENEYLDAVYADLRRLQRESGKFVDGGEV